MKIFLWILGGAALVGIGLFITYIIAMSRIH
jgi:hypothetical protein